MSSLINLGSRLLDVRSRLGAPQSKIAAKLGIADRTYKNYETGKRELPLSTALAFCDAFNVNLQWLVSGETSLNLADANRLFDECVLVVLDEVQSRKLTITNAKVAKICAYLAKQCLEKDTNPKEEIDAVLELII
jgi:transcriptional regulator with XRE-family HTH domain